MYIIGVDPGPVTGLVGLELDRTCTQIERIDVVQCSAGCVLNVLGGLVGQRKGLLCAIERFVVRLRASRSNEAKAGEVARAVAAQVAEWAKWHGELVERRAIDVKPWATDQRLLVAGLLQLCTGMRHARDAARHALYAAVRAGIPDPLSNELRVRATSHRVTTRGVRPTDDGGFAAAAAVSVLPAAYPIQPEGRTTMNVLELFAGIGGDGDAPVR